MDLLLFYMLQIGMGIFWTITYILIIRYGFKDKVPGMPMAAICANVSWEFIFSFIYPHFFLQRIIDMIWLSLDLVIAYQYLKFGRGEHGKAFTNKYFYHTFLLTLVVCFTVINAVVHEFGDFDGRYAAFSQNLMMSVLFISMLSRRGSLKGQSISIAICKMIGSILPAAAFFIFFSSRLINVISTATLVFDMIYVYLLFTVKFHTSRLSHHETLVSEERKM